MQDFWSFLFSPLGLLVYISYRIFKLFVWLVVLPKLLPHLPKSVQSRVAPMHARLVLRLSAVGDTIQKRLQTFIAKVPVPIKECCA